MTRLTEIDSHQPLDAFPVRDEWLTPRQCEILDQARRLLVSEGPAALTLAGLARQLAVEPSALRQHFSGTDELLRELAVDAMIEQQQALRGAAPDLLAQAEAYRRYALEHRELYRLITEYPFADQPLTSVLVSRQPELMVDALGPDLARAAWAFAHGMVELELDGRFSEDADVDAAWRAGIAAFAAAAATARQFTVRTGGCSARRC